MDDLSLLLQSRITQIRVAKISGEREKVQAKEGSLDVTCRFGLGPSRSENRRLVRLEYSIAGLPENGETKAPPAFTAHIELRGLVEFPKEVDAAELKLDPTVIAVICQPLYATAIQKIASLLMDLGVRNVRLDPDLRTIGDALTEIIEVEASHMASLENNSDVSEQKSKKGANSKPKMVRKIVKN